MPKNVEERVLEMRFDNANFESNVKTSLSTLDKLKQALNFKGASKGLEQIDSAAKKVDFSPMGSGIEAVSAKFSSLQVVGVTALATLTSAAMSAGKQIVSALTVDSVIDGFREYETQINSVQTILSNTSSKGTTIDQVNSALDELNHYADQTIYNFAEMTRNIGTFTAAGVDLDTAVSSIKGIANLAAASGSSSLQASSAMYQLSQAIAAGRVQLMDWNSVVNAGMGGELFQNALKRTAENFGYDVDGMIEKYGSFRESLTQGGWLTADVLTETLSQISGAYTEADLISQGYTEAQAKEIVKLAETASGAATDVKSFTQLMTTLAEALGSGWAQSWRIIVGDYEEAKELFSGISNVLGGMINDSATARNNMLQGWSDLGGRVILIDALRYAFDALMSVINPIKEAFQEIFPPTTSQQLYDLTVAFKIFTKGLKLSDETAANLKSTFRGVFSVVKLVVDAITSFAGAALSLFGSFSGVGDAFLKTTGSIGDYLTKIQQSATQSDAFRIIADGLSKAIQGLFSSFSGVGSGALTALSTLFGGLANSLKSFADVLGGSLSQLWNSLMTAISNSDIQSIANIINSGLFGVLTLSITNFVNSFRDAFGASSGSLLDTLQDFSDNVTDSISNILDTVGASLQAWQTNLNSGTMLKIAAAIGILAISLTAIASLEVEDITNALGAITTLFIEMSAAMALVSKISFTATGVFSGIGGMFSMFGTAISFIGMASSILILANALKELGSLNADQIQNGVLGIAGLAGTIVVTSKLLSKSAPMTLRGAAAIVIFGAALKVFASACEDLGSLDIENLKKGLGSIGAILGALSVFMLVTNRSRFSLDQALGITSIAAAILIFAEACEQLGNLDISVILKGLGTISALLVELSLFSHAVSKNKSILTSASSLIILAATLKLIVDPMKEFANIPVEGVLSGITAIAGALTSMALTLNLLPDKDMYAMAALLPVMTSSLLVIGEVFRQMNGLDPLGVVAGIGIIASTFFVLSTALNLIPDKDLWALATFLPIMTSSLLVIAEYMKKVSEIPFTGMISGIIGLAGVMGILAMSMQLIGNKSFEIVGLMGVAAALLMLGAAIKAISSGGLIGTAATLVTLAGTFTILAFSIKVLSPMIPRLLALSVSITSLSVSLVALGIATAAIGAGFASLISGIVVAILALQQLEPKDVAVGLVSIAGAFTVIAIAGNLLRPAIPSILSLSLAIAQLGLATLAVGAGIALFATSLIALSSVTEDQVNQMVTNIGALATGIGELLPQIADSLLNAFVQIGTIILDAIVQLAPKIADSLLVVLTQVLSSLSTYAPQIVDFLITFLIGIIDTLTARIPELIGSISGFISALFSAIADAMGGVTSGDFFNSAGIVGMFTVLVFGLSTISAMIPSAMIGVLGIGAVIAELTAVLAALGALNQIPGLEWIVGEGGDLLQAVGTAIGQLVGGIVGGVGEGISASLPAIATNLSSFMANLAPFITIAQMIDPGAFDGLSSLAGAIVLICGADIVNAITSFITGGSSIEQFASMITPLGEAMRGFAASMVGVDPNALSIGAQAAASLGSLVNNLPKADGLAQSIFGQSVSIDEFGMQLVAFGGALTAYSVAVSGLNTESINASIAPAQSLMQMCQNLPEAESLKSIIFGGKESLDTFGTNLTSFAGALVSYGSAVSGADYDSITASIEPAKALMEMAANLPEATGFLETLMGGGQDTLANFGNNLKSFGGALSSYSESLQGVDVGRINSVTSAINSIFSFAKGLVDFDYSGVENATNISGLGTALNDYYNSISGIDTEKLSSSAWSIQTLVDVVRNSSGVDFTTAGNGISSFIQSLSDIAPQLSGISQSFSDFSGQMIVSVTVGFNTVTSTLQNSATQISASMTSLSATFAMASATISSTFSALVVNLSAQIPMFGQIGLQSATTFVQTAIPIFQTGARQFQLAGRTFMEMLRSGILSMESSVTSACRSVALACGTAMSNYNSFYNAGVDAMRGFADGINAGRSNAINAAARVASDALRAAKDELDSHSPSKEFMKLGSDSTEGLAIGLEKKSGMAESKARGVAQNILSAVSTAMNLASDIINNGGMDLSPRITPVIDMSQMSSGLRSMNRSLAYSTALSGSISASMSADQYSSDSANQNGSGNATPTVSFVQNNYSPKALSRIDIYRDTKNQLSQMKGALSK